MEADPLTNLVLSRKKHERIHIGDNIVLEVKECRPGRVTLMVTAPKSLGVWRGEIVDALAAAVLSAIAQD